MGVRRRGPALIELVRGARMDAPTPPARIDPPTTRAPAAPPRPPPPPPASRPAPSPSPAPHEEPGWPTAGDSIRVPVGYIFLAVGAIIGVFIIAYFIGFSRGEVREKTRLAAAEPPLPSPDLDPLNRPLANQPTDTRAAPGSQTRAPDGKSTSKTQGSNATGAGGGAKTPERPAQLPGDPRTPGLNYFILADRIHEDEAQKAADFLTSHNLAAAVVHSNNARFRRVIATRGFPGSEVSGADAQKLRQEAARIGQLYKSQQQGQVDFAKVYPEKFQP